MTTTITENTKSTLGVMGTIILTAIASVIYVQDIKSDMKVMKAQVEMQGKVLEAMDTKLEKINERFDAVRMRDKRGSGISEIE